MPIDFSCPACGKPFSVRDELANRKSVCPDCKAPVVVPQAANYHSPPPVRMPPPQAAPAPLPVAQLFPADAAPVEVLAPAPAPAADPWSSVDGDDRHGVVSSVIGPEPWFYFWLSASGGLEILSATAILFLGLIAAIAIIVNAPGNPLPGVVIVAALCMVTILRGIAGAAHAAMWTDIGRSLRELRRSARR